MISKKQLRLKYLDIRNNISKYEKEYKSKKVFDKLIRHDAYCNAKQIFTYVSMKNELDTISIINHSLSNNKIVAVPKVFPNRQLKFFNITSFNQLSINKFGILEPIDDSIEIIPNNKTIFIVPGIVFDKNNNRIGYGGGYYDRYLSKYPNLLFIALAYDFQVIEKIPTTILDIKMDEIITND